LYIPISSFGYILSNIALVPNIIKSLHLTALKI
jgi:hypothetical protein